MLKNGYFGLAMAIALGVASGAFRVAAAENDFTYQSLTNLGPCASSRVLLMNNDTNPICPIQGQGYYDTNETATAVGGTFWWHDDEIISSSYAKAQLNLMPGVEHILYQKTDNAGGKKALWTLVDCRAGAGGYKASSSNNANRNYLPWSGTCQPIDQVNYPTVPIPETWKNGATYLEGIKQVAHISMRGSTDAVVYSPLYEEGIGEIYFDIVNGWANIDNDTIEVQIATGLKVEESADGDSDEVHDMADGLDWDAYKWETVPCDMFEVASKSSIALPSQNANISTLTLSSKGYFANLFYRVRVSVNVRAPVRFRIRRLSSHSTNASPDFGGLIYIDNIIVSYPGVSAQLSPMGVLSKSDDNSENGGRANIG